MNNQIQPRRPYGQAIAPDHSNSSTSVGALQNPNSLAREGVSARRDQRLFFRDANGHIQYISPDAFGAYDEHDEFFLECSRDRFFAFCAYQERIGVDPTDLFHNAFVPVPNSDIVRVYTNYDFNP